MIGSPQRSERVPAEPSAESLHAGNTDPVNLVRVTVEHDDARFTQDLGDLGGVTRLVIVVAEHGDDRDLRGRAPPRAPAHGPPRAVRSR